MKKKIKDLTLKEAEDICKKHVCRGNCPLYINSCICFIDLLKVDFDFNNEVEVDEKNINR